MPIPFELALWGLLLLSLVMTVAWLRQRTTGNAGLVDPIWTLAIGALAISYAVLADGWAPRRALVGVLVGAWSLRLGLHLVQRVRSEPEDGRYAKFREAKGAGFERWLFWFFQAQALLAVLLSLVFLVLCAAPQVGWRLWDALAVLLWITALCGEAIADRQLARWRGNEANRGRTCRAGLWATSRHPNYFFEWLLWIVYPLLGIGLPHGLLLWAAPALMLFFVLKVTGIPITEEQALKSRGDDYRDYQRTTNAFFPGPSRARTQERPEPS